MSFRKCLRGLGSGREYPPDRVMNLCEVDNRPVEIVLDLERLARERPDRSWYHPERKDMWRFGGLMALDVDDPEDRSHIVCLGEGHTPLEEFADHPLAQKAGFTLLIKDEGSVRSGFGCNPTQSFKDRGMAMVVSMAKKLGITKLAAPTQGNAGDSLAEYGVRAGMQVAVVMPDDTDLPILGKVAAYAKLYPKVELDLVKGTIREAGQLVKERYLTDGYFSAATFQEPGWRIEGKKTLGLEIAEPRNGSDAWKLPDVVVYPTGGGTGILGMWKAFAELAELGVVNGPMPRFVAVQSSLTAPVVEAFDRGDDDTTVVQAGRTVATGINVPGGVGHFQVLKILRESQGCAVAVSEESIRSELRQAYRQRGLWLCPEGAATLAALPELVDRNVIRPGDEVVCFNTASAEKYLPAIRADLRG